MKIQKRIHNIWKEGAHKLLGHNIVGKYQYFYSTDKGVISLIKIYGYPITTEETNWDSYQWEIYGYGLDDVERFNTKEDAEERIKELLN